MKQWRDIPGYEGLYQVSADGFVRSLAHIVKRIGQGDWPLKERVLKPAINDYRRVTLRKDGKSKTYTIAQLMGRAFLKLRPGQVVDHRNRRKTDDRLNNLRPATYQGNAANSDRRRSNTSGFVGVCWNKYTNKWQANIRHSGQKHTLGQFNTPEEAHAAYCVAARKHHGEFANV